MGSRTTVLVGVLATTVVLAGCTTTANGTPEPIPNADGTTTSSPDTSDSSPPSSEQNSAPRVTNPLDVSPYFADACAALTPEQQITFGMTRHSDPRPEDDVIGPGCTWHGDPGSVGISFLTGNEGLSDTYKVRERNEYFVETTVDEFPAVFTDGADLRAQGNCAVVVGVADTLTFVASEQGKLDAEGACDRAKQVAAAAIATMKAGA